MIVSVGISLAILAFALAWPAPVILAQASWPSRAPALALILWQAIALSGCISMIGAPLALGLTPSGSITESLQLLAAKLWSGPIPDDFGVVHIASLTIAVGLLVHLALNTALTSWRAERERRKQQQMIAMLSEPYPGSPRTRVLDHPVPVAYCVPGIQTTTVLTEGLVRALSTDELRAVIAHERTHLEQFHHLVLLSFRAWHSALPWFPIANRAERSVTMLTELLADDGAVRSTSASALSGAARRVSDAMQPGILDGGHIEKLDAETIESRIIRLNKPPLPLSPAYKALIILTILALVAGPILALTSIMV